MASDKKRAKPQIIRTKKWLKAWVKQKNIKEGALPPKRIDELYELLIEHLPKTFPTETLKSLKSRKPQIEQELKALNKMCKEMGQSIMVCAGFAIGWPFFAAFAGFSAAAGIAGVVIGLSLGAIILSGLVATAVKALVKECSLNQVKSKIEQHEKALSQLTPPLQQLLNKMIEIEENAKAYGYDLSSENARHLFRSLLTTQTQTAISDHLQKALEDDGQCLHLLSTTGLSIDAFLKLSQEELNQQLTTLPTSSYADITEEIHDTRDDRTITIHQHLLPTDEQATQAQKLLDSAPVIEIQPIVMNMG